eukprot:23852-Eustigmatos_ZCMA.PRE.1
MSQVACCSFHDFVVDPLRSVLSPFLRHGGTLAKVPLLQYAISRSTACDTFATALQAFDDLSSRHRVKCRFHSQM